MGSMTYIFGSLDIAIDLRQAVNAKKLIAELNHEKNNNLLHLIEPKSLN